MNHPIAEPMMEPITAARSKVPSPFGAFLFNCFDFILLSYLIFARVSSGFLLDLILFIELIMYAPMARTTIYDIFWWISSNQRAER